MPTPLRYSRSRSRSPDGSTSRDKQGRNYKERYLVCSLSDVEVAKNEVLAKGKELSYTEAESTDT